MTYLSTPQNKVKLFFALTVFAVLLHGCTRTVYVQNPQTQNVAAQPSPPVQQPQYNGVGVQPTAPSQQYATPVPVQPIADAQQQPPPQVVPPDWAPVYDNAPQVRYYYLPDIGVYYDVWTQQYICPYNGSWAYYSQLPPAYSNYNPNSGFVVVLSQGADQPWRRHEYYAEHYPRNYSQTVYHNYNGSRGYNENAKNVMYGDRHGNHSMPQGGANGYPSDNNNNNQRDQPNNTVISPSNNVWNHHDQPNNTVVTPADNVENHRDQPNNTVVTPANNDQSHSVQRGNDFVAPASNAGTPHISQPQVAPSKAPSDPNQRVQSTSSGPEGKISTPVNADNQLKTGAGNAPKSNNQKQPNQVMPPVGNSQLKNGQSSPQKQGTPPARTDSTKQGKQKLPPAKQDTSHQKDDKLK